MSDKISMSTEPLVTREMIEWLKTAFMTPAERKAAAERHRRMARYNAALQGGLHA